MNQSKLFLHTAANIVVYDALDSEAMGSIDTGSKRLQ